MIVLRKRDSAVRKKIIVICVILIILILLLLPPVMICKGGIVLGKRTENFDNAENHIYTAEQMSNMAAPHTTSDFDYFFFVNFRFWENIEITQIQFLNKIEQPRITKYFGCIYRVEQNRRHSYLNSFAVSRGKSHWYFDYYAVEI